MSCVFYECVCLMDHFLEQTAHARASDWSVSYIPALWLVTNIMMYRWPGLLPGTGDDIAICHDSYDGLMIVTLLSRGSEQSEPSIWCVEQWEASIKPIDQWEASSVSPHVYCNDNWGHIKCDGDFLAHNECIVNITLLKYKYKTDCKTYHFQNSVWCICLACDGSL